MLNELDFSQSPGYLFTEGYNLTADGDCEASEEGARDWYMFLAMEVKSENHHH